MKKKKLTGKYIHQEVLRQLKKKDIDVDVTGIGNGNQIGIRIEFPDNMKLFMPLNKWYI